MQSQQATSSNTMDKDIIFEGVYSWSATDNMPVVTIKDYSFNTMSNQNKNRELLTS